MIKLCLECGKEFEGKSSQKYCNSICRDSARKRIDNANRTKKRKDVWEQMEHTKICPICGEEFELTQQHRKKKYCSDKCLRKAERVFGCKSDTDLKYKDKIRFGGNRELALKRDEYTCTMCGKKSNLIVHHIDCSGQSDDVNNDLDNLTTLCRRCHINLHKIIG